LTARLENNAESFVSPDQYVFRRGEDIRDGKNSIATWKCCATEAKSIMEKFLFALLTTRKLLIGLTRSN